MAATRVVMHQIVLPAEVDVLGICFGGQVRETTREHANLPCCQLTLESLNT
jgi:acyl-CoA hydrolase